MGVFHDAYLIGLDALANQFRPTLMSKEESYFALRSAGLRAFDENLYVRELADHYGAWDKTGLLELERTPPYTPYDFAFWAMLLVYDQCIEVGSPRIGLGYGDIPLSSALELLGWTELERNLVIYGHEFATFARTYLHVEDEFWEYVKPISTVPHAGWIGRDEIPDLLARLRRNESRLADVAKDIALAVDSKTTVENAYASAIRMLFAAQEAKTDLCIIVSG
jgi:hypothetical protein